MPYITPEARETLAVGISRMPDTVGELNYLLTKVCFFYYSNKGRNYSAVNDVVGALECAKAEFYRRVAVPYEDKKIFENGDVF